ncbi:hypothetical protein BKA67DRAFT_561283 [Truncatella angustata]|uniref:COP9 signalosome complex subunit 3 n=1 Tax=Truncatella angustata TaxID=152316 RepID=A0A9P8UNU8_9PEZI|nr:uncharacterized protein BKA67DRAFT_561283 [Truncatella angustata]KAH6655622.1 hypothetical protein BKA67DRAFT_561283 [Truncatella angustata]
MDNTASICLGFPPEHPTDTATYEAAVNAHLTQLVKLIGDPSRPLQAQGPQLLKLLDPSLNSLSYLAVLHGLLIPTLPSEREFLLEKLVTFLVCFDARQARYAGQHIRDLLDLVAKGQVLPPSVAVHVLASAILRLDPTGSMLTSTHISLVKLAYGTDTIEPALDVIDKNIVFYPNMGPFKKPAELNDLSLPPTAYIAENTGLTAAVKPPAVLEYDLLRGLMYCSRRDWPKALAALERVVAYPTRDHGISKIMVEAYKKWVLVSLLCNGKPSPSPVSATSATSKAYNTLGKLYREVATIFETDNAADLKRKADVSTKDWLDDGNTGLVQEVLSAYQEWQIINLQHIYTKISISEIRKRTKSAQTGAKLARDEDVQSLIQNMAISGKLNGVIEKNDDGVTFLTFLPSSAALSEIEFANQLAGTAARLKALEPILKVTNERLGTSKEYIRHLAKRKNQDSDKDGDVPMGFGEQIEDENLMDDSLADAVY